MTENFPNCPQCESEYVYPDQSLLICSLCGYEWNPNEIQDDGELCVDDANGNKLRSGDKATVIKDLKVKGNSQVIKIGTKVTIKYVRDTKDHELDCKIDGGIEMMITAKFVKKA